MPINWGPGSFGPDILSMKVNLNTLKYLNGDAANYNPFYGVDTEAAILKFRTDKGLGEAGTVDATVLAAIRTAAGEAALNNIVYALGGVSINNKVETLAPSQAYTLHITSNDKSLYSLPTINQISVSNPTKIDKSYSVSGDVGSLVLTPHADAIGLTFAIGIDMTSSYQDGGGNFSGDWGSLEAFICTNKLTAIKTAVDALTGDEKTIRTTLVLQALSYAFDYDKFPDLTKSNNAAKLRCLYVFGANLYTPSLTIYCPSVSTIQSNAHNQPSYYSSGRKEKMIEAINLFNQKIPAADCSGLIVGLWRKNKVMSASFDANANSLCGSGYTTSVSSSALKPADLVGKDGHVGMYVGGGYVVEAAGGAYGVQLTLLSNRVCYDFTDDDLATCSKWTRYRAVKVY